MLRERILILDHNEPLRKETAQVLSAAGYHVDYTESLPQALAEARTQPFDLVLAYLYSSAQDLMCIQHIRDVLPDVAGIAVTSSVVDTFDLSIQAIEAGFDGILIAPYPPEQLISSVITALEQARLRRENTRLHSLVPLYELSRSFMGATDLAQVLNQVVSTVRSEMRAGIASLMLLDEELAELTIAAADGLPAEIVETQRRAVGTGIAGLVAESGERLLIADDEPLDPKVMRLLGSPRLGSALILPLKARGETIGVLNISRLRGIAPFTHGDLELATVLAGQAAVAIDQARLIDVMRNMSETSQRLAGAFDLDDAARIVLEAAAQLAGTKRAILWLVEDISSQLTFFKSIGFDSDSERSVKAPAFLSPLDSRTTREQERRGIVSLPIARGDRKFGLLELYLTPPKRPRPDRLGVLRTLAHTAAAVIESHRLRAREAIAFREIDLALRGESNIHQVLERLMRQIAEACGAQNGAIFIRGGENGDSTPWVELGSGAPHEVAREAIAANHAVLHNIPDAPGRSIGSIIAAPLTVGTRVEGAIVLTHRDPRMFGQRHLNLLTVLSSSAALIVRNAQLYAWSEEKVISEERARMAREIHDGLAQDINFMLMRAQTLQTAERMGKEINLARELEQLIQTLRRDVREVRQTIFALRPVEIETLGFVPALEKFVQDFGNANETHTHFRVRGEMGGISPKSQSALYRLAQEALHNIRKHANASNVWVHLDLDREWAHLQVRDDGKGFDIIQALDAARGRGSVGILQMRERTERAGGTFEIETATGQGTIIRVKLPLR